MSNLSQNVKDGELEFDQSSREMGFFIISRKNDLCDDLELTREEVIKVRDVLNSLTQDELDKITSINDL
jgi:hypothetical protein